MRERILGRLEEFKVWATKEFKDIRHDQEKILEKLDDLSKDRWIMYGKITILNGILFTAVEICAHMILG